jgi:chromosome segregation ATPase
MTTGFRDAERHRQINVLEESLRRAEGTIASIRAEMHTLTERNKVVLCEGDDGRTKHDHLHNETKELKEKLLILQAEFRNLTDVREFEIESLRTLLREAREQKERAISARHTADRERDEYIAKYEEKCRDVERFEESASAHYHAHSESKGGSRSFTRTVSSGTTLHHDKHSHGADGHGHSHGGGMFSP